MATYYRYKRPITNSGAITSTTKTVEEWQEETTHAALLVIEDSDGDLHDYSEFVSELQIVHNDVDGDEAGRSKTSGARMKRSFLANKHTLNVKLVNHLPQSVAFAFFGLIATKSSRDSFRVWYQSPCASARTSKTFYCSTINYGAQRYDKQTDRCYYDGMNFNLIEM